MKIHSQTTLEKNGWELTINKSKTIPQAKTGDLVEINITATPIDETDDPIRSVIQHPLWVKIEKIDDNNIHTGVLKSKLGYILKVKDGTTFDIGATISFAPENIFLIRKNLNKSDI